jgi:hypothetical protein
MTAMTLITMNKLAVDEYVHTSITHALEALKTVTDTDHNVCADVFTNIRTLCYSIADLRTDPKLYSHPAVENKIQKEYRSITFGLLAQNHYSRADAQRMTTLFNAAFPSLTDDSDSVRERIFTRGQDFMHEMIDHREDREQRGFSPLVRSILLSPQFREAHERMDYDMLMQILDKVHTCTYNWNQMMRSQAVRISYQNSNSGVDTSRLLAECFEHGWITLTEVLTVDEACFSLRHNHRLVPFWLTAYPQLDTDDQRAKLAQFMVYITQNGIAVGQVNPQELAETLRDERQEHLPVSLIAAMVTDRPQAKRITGRSLKDIVRSL